jgi:hypothetical protein
MSDFDNIKDPDHDREFGIDFHDELAMRAVPKTDYGQGSIIYFEEDTGFLYEVTTAGRTSAGYPRNLPRTPGQTVDYGSCILTCRHPSSVSQTTISSATWTVPAGLTNASQRISGLIAFVTLQGGADGADYDVTCAMTPSSGPPIDKTITISVRSE